MKLDSTRPRVLTSLIGVKVVLERNYQFHNITLLSTNVHTDTVQNLPLYYDKKVHCIKELRLTSPTGDKFLVDLSQPTPSHSSVHPSLKKKIKPF